MILERNHYYDKCILHYNTIACSYAMTIHNIHRYIKHSVQLKKINILHYIICHQKLLIIYIVGKYLNFELLEQ